MNNIYFIALFSLLSISSKACLCYDYPMDEQLQKADFIFEGVLDSLIEDFYGSGKYVFLLEVKKVYNFKEKYIEVPDYIYLIKYSCSTYYPTKGERYLIYANNRGAVFHDSECSRSGPLTSYSVVDDIKYLEKEFGSVIPKIKCFQGIQQIQDSISVIKELVKNLDDKNAKIKEINNQLYNQKIYLVTLGIVSVLLLIFIAIKK